MRKINVAICDDEQEELEIVCNMLKQYELTTELKIEKFLSADELLKSENSAWDIVLLDIEMEAPTGFEAACVLSKRTPKPLVIFVTKSDAYTTRGYGIAFRYLVKPISSDEFMQAIDAAFGEISANRFSFQMDNSLFSVPFQEIYYMESFGHLSIIHTLDTEYRIRASLSEIYDRLPKSRIAIPHKSYLVNMEYINRATANEVILTNGVRIPISRRKKQEFNDAFFKYLGR